MADGKLEYFEGLFEGIEDMKSGTKKDGSLYKKYRLKFACTDGPMYFTAFDKAYEQLTEGERFKVGCSSYQSEQMTKPSYTINWVGQPDLEKTGEAEITNFKEPTQKEEVKQEQTTQSNNYNPAAVGQAINLAHAEMVKEGMTLGEDEKNKDVLLERARRILSKTNYVQDELKREALKQ